MTYTNSSENECAWLAPNRRVFLTTKTNKHPYCVTNLPKNRIVRLPNLFTPSRVSISAKCGLLRLFWTHCVCLTWMLALDALLYKQRTVSRRGSMTSWSLCSATSWSRARKNTSCLQPLTTQSVGRSWEHKGEFSAFLRHFTTIMIPHHLWASTVWINPSKNDKFLMLLLLLLRVVSKVKEFTSILLRLDSQAA